MTSTSRSPIVIIGGGIAGLTAAALLGRQGVPAVVLEKSGATGGRAVTHDRRGFLFNLGPHALYRAGILSETLRTLGVEVSGHLPPTSGGFALRDGHRHTLPVGLTTLLTTGLLTLGGKLEMARVQQRLLRVDTDAIQSETFASWLDAHVTDAGVRGVIEMLVRVTSFTNDPARQSAGAAIAQLQLALRATVLYLDGGWQTIVDGLREAAIAAGARVMSNARVAALEGSASGHVTTVRLADGSSIDAAGIIIAAGPAEVDTLAGTTLQSSLVPVRVATLEVGLRRTPNAAAKVAFGIDTPLYFSIHSAVARLAPSEGALIHATKYLAPGEQADGAVEQELETLMDMMQPGWRTVVEVKQFVPSLTVTHAELVAAHGGMRGRPPAALPMFDNVCIAGDWVGPRGQLSDGAAASAADAVATLTGRLDARATSHAARVPLEAAS
jgi:phytoene dehydrogenase-like protein